MSNEKQIQVKRVKLCEPKYRRVDKYDHSITVWTFAGNVLADLGLEQNGDLQYALMGWLKKYNSEQNNIVSLDGWFDYNSIISYPSTKTDVINACTEDLSLNKINYENYYFKNDIAIIGYSDNPAERKSFLESAQKAGYSLENENTDRIVFENKKKPEVNSGQQLIKILKKYGSPSNPITGMFFSTHGVPYAIDFFNSKNNLYIPKEDFEKLYKNATGNEWKPNKDVAYVNDIINLVNAKIIADDVTITLCGCLNGAEEFSISEKMEPVTRQWQLENGKLKQPKNIAYYFSKLLPKATVIANTTNVNSGVGLDRPVMYKNGVYIKL